MRIIPALAGTTWTHSRNRVWHSDHPRAGGDHITLTALKTDKTGSSPRWRGPRG